MKKKQPIVVFKKLGKLKSYPIQGWAHFDENLIEIDTRLTAYNTLQTLIHERNHLLHPDWSETKVTEVSRTMAQFLWGMGYRSVALK